MEYKLSLPEDNASVRQNDAKNLEISSDSEEAEQDPQIIQQQIEEFEALLSTHVDMASSEDPSLISQGLILLNEDLQKNPSYVTQIVNNLTIAQYISNIEDISPDLGKLAIDIIRLFIEKTDPEVYEENVFSKTGLATSFLIKLENEIPYEYAIDIIEVTSEMLKKWPNMNDSFLCSGFVSRVIDIAYSKITDKPPSRDESQDKYSKDVNFTSQSIDINDNDDRLIAACIKFLTAFLITSDGLSIATIKECIDYIILYSFCEELPLASAEALESMKKLFEKINSPIYDALFGEMKKCGKVNDLIELAFNGNETAWFCICDIFSSTKMNKSMVESETIGMIQSILRQSKEAVAEINSIKDPSEEDAMNNEAMLKKAEEMEILALSALAAASSSEENGVIIEQIISSGVLELVMASIVESPLRAKCEACCVFSNLASCTTKVSELLEAFPDLPLQLLQSLQTLPVHEKNTVLTSIKSIIDFAIKSGTIDPVECIGGEEGQDIIDELLDTVDVNLYEVVAGIKATIVASLEDEDGD